jgi:hypothetical protein
MGRGLGPDKSVKRLRTGIAQLTLAALLVSLCGVSWLPERALGARCAPLRPILEALLPEVGVAPLLAGKLDSLRLSSEGAALERLSAAIPVYERLKSLEPGHLALTRYESFLLDAAIDGSLPESLRRAVQGAVSRLIGRAGLDADSRTPRLLSRVLEAPPAEKEHVLALMPKRYIKLSQALASMRDSAGLQDLVAELSKLQAALGLFEWNIRAPLTSLGRAWVLKRADTLPLQQLAQVPPHLIPGGPAIELIGAAFARASHGPVEDFAKAIDALADDFVKQREVDDILKALAVFHPSAKVRASAGRRLESATTLAAQAAAQGKVMPLVESVARAAAMTDDDSLLLQLVDRISERFKANQPNDGDSENALLWIAENNRQIGGSVRLSGRARAQAVRALAGKTGIPSDKAFDRLLLIRISDSPPEIESAIKDVLPAEELKLLDELVGLNSSDLSRREAALRELDSPSGARSRYDVVKKTRAFVSALSDKRGAGLPPEVLTAIRTEMAGAFARMEAALRRQPPDLSFWLDSADPKARLLGKTAKKVSELFQDPSRMVRFMHGIKLDAAVIAAKRGALKDGVAGIVVEDVFAALEARGASLGFSDVHALPPKQLSPLDFASSALDPGRPFKDPTFDIGAHGVHTHWVHLLAVASEFPEELAEVGGIQGLMKALADDIRRNVSAGAGEKSTLWVQIFDSLDGSLKNMSRPEFFGPFLYRTLLLR